METWNLHIHAPKEVTGINLINTVMGTRATYG